MSPEILDVFQGCTLVNVAEIDSAFVIYSPVPLLSIHYLLTVA